jgi:phosphodiesterase/alkaline phosphatase D-like protein
VVVAPALGHAVHVEVEGLDPGRHYWYRFRAGGHLSQVGRTKTCADPRIPLGRLALAFVSCQNFERGYYTAYRHLAEEDLDVVLHLGDHQRGWLLDGLDHSQARWNVLAQQVVMAELDLHPGARPLLVQRRLGRPRRRPRPHPPVPLGAPAGQPDRAHPRHPRLPGQRPAAPGPRCRLPGGGDPAGRHLDQLRGQQEHRLPQAPRGHPHIRFFESRLRGYTRCTVIRERWYADLRVVDTIERRGAPVRTPATYVVENDRPGAEQV